VRRREQDAADEQAALSTKGVGHLSAEQRAECRTWEQQRADDERLARRREVEVLLHVEERAGDDPGVVAEEQAAERRDDGELRQVTLPDPPLCHEN
jgi:hypothetical protein